MHYAPLLITDFIDLDISKNSVRFLEMPDEF